MWELKRKLVYALAFVLTLFAASLFLLRGVLFPEPTCFDGKQNAFESGIDCGGGCLLMCKEEFSEISVLWAKAVKAGSSSYDLVALVTNPNINNASQKVDYTFTLYDEAGTVMKTLPGSTITPLDGKFPLIVQGVSLPKAPSNIVLTLTDGPHYKVPERPASPTIKIVSRRYEAGTIPRVYATIANTKRIEILNLPVRVILFDTNDNAYAVGQTLIPSLGKEGVQEIIVTWDEPLPYPPTRIGIYPIFNPFEAKQF